MMEVARGGGPGAARGVVACCVSLVFKPVALVKEMPAKDKQSVSVVYYVPGAESSDKSKGWQAKKKQFIPGTSISVVDDTLNSWEVYVSPQTTTPPQQPAPGTPPIPPIHQHGC